MHVRRRWTWLGSATGAGAGYVVGVLVGGWAAVALTVVGLAIGAAAGVPFDAARGR